jgi:LysM repeat protein
MLHHDRMRPILWLPFSSALALILSGCASNDGSSANNGVGTGPFDSRGNYREDWANDPSKWRKPGSPLPTSGDDLPVIAKNEQPPPNANPLAPSESFHPKTQIAPVKPIPSEIASQTRVSDPSSHSSPKVVKVRPESSQNLASSHPKSSPRVVKVRPEPSPDLASSHPKSSPSVVKVRPEPSPDLASTHPKSSTGEASTHRPSSSGHSKTKTKSGRYLVKKGDSLSTIARRNHSSVSAIQKANGIDGTLIHPGDALIVPKR